VSRGGREVRLAASPHWSSRCYFNAQIKETMNMSSFVVWIDHQHATTFRFSGSEVQVGKLEAHQILHHTHRIDGVDRDHAAKKLFAEAATAIHDAEKVLLLGPGLAKHSFQTYLSEHHPRIFRTVVGCESMESRPTQAQIIDFAKRYFAAEEVMPHHG
jgi:stalled ribosome rescue protein Dom34